MDAFARRALISSRFVYPVAKFIRRGVGKQAYEIEQDKKLIDSPSPFLETPSVSSMSSDDDKYRRHAKTKRVVQDFPEEAAERKDCKDHKRKHKKSSSPSSSMDLSPTLSSSDRESLVSNLSWLELEHKAHKAKNTETKLPVLQTVKKHYALAFDYRTYHLANRSSLYDVTVSSYIVKLVMKIKSQMKAHFFDPKDPISIIGFLATFKLACDTNKIHEGVAMWVLSHYLKDTLANALNSRMCAEDRSASLPASERNEPRSRKLLRSYPEVVNYLFKKISTDQAIAENDAAILRYMQPSGMTQQQYADDLVVKSCKSATYTTKEP